MPPPCRHLGNKEELFLVVGSPALDRLCRANASLLGVSNEIQEILGLGTPFFLFRFLEGLGDVATAVVDQAKGPLDLETGLGTHPGTLETDGIDTSHHTGAVGGYIRGDVFRESLPSPYHAKLADSQKLVKHRASSEHRTILNFDIAGKQAVVGNDHLIGDRGIVAEMNPHHQKVLIADARYRSFLGTAMNRHVFTDDIVIAYHDFAVGARLEVVILRVGPQNSPIADGIARPHPDMARDHGMCLNPTALTDDGTGFNDDTGSHFNISGKVG